MEQHQESEVQEDPTTEVKGLYGATSFQEMDELQAVRETRAAVMSLTDQFISLTQNIMYDEEIEDKSTAIMSLAGDFAARVQTAAKKEATGPGVWDRVKSFFGQDEEVPTDSFMSWKEGPDTYWLAVYSNNYRDSDNPPEILSAESHKEFVSAVDNGEWPHPELWLWHVKGTRWGETTFLAYDEDSGFTVAVGLVDKGMEHIAATLGEMSDIRVSHGMPAPHIHHDKDDPSIITSYRTREISPLPGFAAANKATTFSILKEQDTMIPEHKREFLSDLGILGDLEAALAAKKEEMEAEGVESKETEETPEAEVIEETEEVKAEDVNEASPETAPESPTMDDLVSAITDAISMAVEPLHAEIAGLKEKQSEMEEKQAEDFLSLTPPQSLAEMVAKSVIGAKETKLRSNAALGNDAPKETDPEQTEGKSIGIPFIDAMRSGNDWRDTFPHTEQ